MSSICRELNTNYQIEPFVDGILEIPLNFKKFAVNKIAEAERNMQSYKFYQTLTSLENRDFNYRDPEVREKLRATIVQELLKFERLDNDDKIVIGEGGSKPKTEVKTESKAFYIIGPPASGKSGVASKIADHFGAYILDSDFAKRKLPEYDQQIGAASLTHEESDDIVFNTEKGLISYCLSNKNNIVFSKIGQDANSIIKFATALTQIKYKVYLILIDLDRKKATQRAYNRFLDTSRYVPLALIFDGYGNQPILNYYRIKQQSKELFSGFVQISTDVEKGKNPIIVETDIPEIYKLFE